MTICSSNDLEEEAWLFARICKVEEQIEAYEEAILQLGTGAVQTYTLDTGQTRQTVTKANLTELRKALDSLENRRVTLKARLGGGVVNVVPGF